MIKFVYYTVEIIDQEVDKLVASFTTQQPLFYIDKNDFIDPVSLGISNSANMLLRIVSVIHELNLSGDARLEHKLRLYTVHQRKTHEALGGLE